MYRRMLNDWEKFKEFFVFFPIVHFHADWKQNFVLAFSLIPGVRQKTKNSVEKKYLCLVFQKKKIWLIRRIWIWSVLLKRSVLCVN